MFQNKDKVNTALSFFIMYKFNIEISDDDLLETKIDACTEHIAALADKIKRKSGTISYYKDKEIPHGEVPSEFSSDLEELCKMYLIISKLV